MSFGFSIGDIILLSQLAYNLYASVSSGRKAATRDLRELEEVLFSLKCALDHLKEVSNDVLARPGLRDSDLGFKEKLDVMISSCASTLQELDTVTKKYRVVENEASKEKKNRRTLEDVKKSFQVNWQRVRWDHEKQSLQQYREKLKSHTDAINLILTSVVWANTAFADESSKKNHEKTQSLLGDVLRNPGVDAEFRAMVQEMHAILVKPSPKAEDIQKAMMKGTTSPHDQLDITAYTMSGSVSGESFGPIEKHGRGLSSMRMYAMSALPYRTPKAIANTDDTAGEALLKRAMDVRSWKGQPTAESEYPRKHSTGDRELPTATVELNNERRAFGAKEYEAFRQRYAQPAKVSKPSFLTSATPTGRELQACIPHIFRSTADGKQQTQERRNEIDRWTHEFARFVKDGSTTQRVKDECALALLGALNEAVESSSGRMRQLFYEASDSAGFAAALNQVESSSKSVRVMKEIEEFQDAKEEWEERTVR